MRARLSAAIVSATLFLVASAVHAQQSDYAPFVGEYVGQIVIETETGLAKRDLAVSIRREDDGFSLEWTTNTQRPDGRLKFDTYFVAFKPSPRAGYYLPTDKIDRFGARLPLDPLKGDPQLVARIDGKTMTVYASLIDEDGGHEVQVYERTLVPGGMTLKFSRTRNGEPLKAIEAELTTKEQRINLK